MLKADPVFTIQMPQNTPSICNILYSRYGRFLTEQTEEVARVNMPEKFVLNGGFSTDETHFAMRNRPH